MVYDSSLLLSESIDRNLFHMRSEPITSKRIDTVLDLLPCISNSLVMDHRFFCQAIKINIDVIDKSRD